MSHQTHGPLGRDVLRLTGADTLPLLQGLFTNNIDTLAEGGTAHGALLTPQGKILECFFLMRTDTELFVDLAAGQGAGLAKRLMLYRLRADMQIEDVTDQWDIAVTPGDGDRPPGAIIGSNDPRPVDLGARWLCPRTATPPVDTDYRAAEIALGVPAFNSAFGANAVFALDVNLDRLGGIDHKKGCFVGQEVASRMFRKGEIKKRTWQAHGDGLGIGDSLKAADRTVATVTAVCDTAPNHALALVRVDRLNDESDAPVSGPAGQPVRLTPPAYLTP